MSIYEQAMRRLAAMVRILSVVLAALVARSVIDGLTLTLGFAAGIVAALLVSAVALLRQGRRFKPSREFTSPSQHPKR